MAWTFPGNRKSDSRKPFSRRRRKNGLLSRGRRPLFEELEARHLLTVFTVTNLSDAAVAPAGSLRDAVNQANASAGADIIQFQAGLVGTLAMAAGAGEMQISDPLTINGPGVANVTIDATASTSRVFNLTDEAGDVTIKGLALTKGMAGALNDGGAIYSESLGLVSVADSSITGSSAGDDGGAIYTSGNLSLINVTIGGAGAGLPNAAIADGGGVYSGGNVTISNSTISGNTAGGDGGGVYAAGTVTIENATIGGAAAGAGNTATSSGGGVASVTVNVTNSTISGNTATANNGGGIYARGNVTLLNSTISGNSAGSNGGGVYSLIDVNATNTTIGGTAPADGNNATVDGGGIFANSVMLQNSAVAGNDAVGPGSDGGGIFASVSAIVKNSTIEGNTADDNGGGVQAANVTLQNATVANNTANTDGGLTGSGGAVFATNKFTMQNSIVVNNTGLATHPELQIPAGNNSKVKSSIISDNTGLPAGAQFTVTGPAGPVNGSGNFIGQRGGANAITAANVFGAGGGTLADNGGPTPTIALLVGAIAIDKGKNSLAVASSFGDQRGLPYVRVSNGTVDMGAFEYQPALPGNNAPVVANAIADQTAIVDTPYVFTFAANTFTDADGNPLAYTATLSGGGALPTWLTFNAAARTFIGVPTAADVGAITVRVTASDGNGGIISDDFVLTVTTNPPPTVANTIPDRTATVSVPFSFTFAANTFSDPNGDTLTYSAALAGGGALPAWLTFNPATRTFGGTPAIGDVGTIAVRVTATDTAGGSVFDDFNIVVSNTELPFDEEFEGAVDPRIVVKSPGFATTNTNPITGTTSYQATRPTVGARPVATVDFGLPSTASNVSNVNVNVSTNGGNGSTLWSNAVIVFDYVSPTNYKFAGVFEIIDKLIIGQVVNGKVQYLQQKAFPAQPNTTIPLALGINRGTGQVTLTSGATSLSYTYKSIGAGTVGIGTINANSRFDSLRVS